MRTSSSAGMRRVFLFFCAVLLLSNPFSLPASFRRAPCQRYSVRRETRNASRVASSPCFSQNISVRNLFSASSLLFIRANRSCLSYSHNQPFVPLNMLNWRMIPLLRGVPNVSEPIHSWSRFVGRSRSKLGRGMNFHHSSGGGTPVGG